MSKQKKSDDFLVIDDSIDLIAEAAEEAERSLILIGVFSVVVLIATFTFLFWALSSI